MEALLQNRFAVTAILLFGIGFCTVLLKQNLLKKVVGFNIMEAAACWLLAGLAPAGEEAGRSAPDLMLVGIVVAAALTAFSLALIWRAYRRFGTIELKELVNRVRGEDE